MNVFLTGTTGFVGRYMLQRLLGEGHVVHGLMRTSPRDKSSFLSSLHPNQEPRFKPVIGDVVSGDGLDAGMDGCDAVIHLVGIIVEKGTNTFAAVHDQGSRNVVEAARRLRIQRFVQMSALGVGANGVAAYQTSKWKGEEEVRQSGIPFCILRPSLIFGPGDGFVTQMMDTMRKAPLFRPVPGNGQGKYRPIFVGDVTACFVRALTAQAATNQTVELGGADELTLDQVLDEIARCAGVGKPVVHIPMPLMFLGAALVQTVLSNPPVTVDQLRMLRQGSTCDIAPMKHIFNIEPRGFSGCGRA